MAEGLNRVQLIGNLTDDAELKVTSGGTQLLKFTVAANERYKDKNQERKERTEFARCTMFGRRAESLSQYLNKGQSVYAEGSLRTSSYEDKDGNKRYRTEVIVSNVILLGRGGQKRQEQASEPSRTGGGGFSDEDYGEDPSSEVPF